MKISILLAIALVSDTSDSSFRWFSLPLEVRGIPEEADFIPVSCPIDFSSILKQLTVTGAVDERSLRLFRMNAGGKEFEMVKVGARQT